jgi:hypothetical protein
MKTVHPTANYTGHRKIKWEGCGENVPFLHGARRDGAAILAIGGQILRVGLLLVEKDWGYLHEILGFSWTTIG